jgi:hypothetical protein
MNAEVSSGQGQAVLRLVHRYEALIGTTLSFAAAGGLPQ